MMHRGGKIRPPRRTINRGSDGDDFAQCWGLIKDALRDIHTKNAGKLSFEQLYRASYKIVLRKRGGELYQRVKEFEEQWFNEMVIPSIWELVTNNLVAITLHDSPGTMLNERRIMGEKFLRGVRESWDTHNSSMNMVADVLMYLDRGFAQDTARPSIYTATIGLYRDHILRAPLPVTGPEEDHAGRIIFDILDAVIIDQVNMERDGDVIDHNLIRNCVGMLEDLYETDEEKEEEKLYLTSFEPVFLKNSRDFYRKECERLLRDADTRAWLRHTQRRFAEEIERCGTTISILTLPKMTKVLEEELVTSHLGEFLAMEGSGLRAMIDNDRLEDLGILYELIARVDPSKKALKQALSARIIELGLEIEKVLKETDFSVASAGGGAAAAAEAADGGAKALSASAQQTAAAIKWVEDVLSLKEKFDRLWKQCFREDLAIQSAMASSFTELFRLCRRSAEYVSLFIDDNFKRGLRGKSDAEIDGALDKATTMIRHLTEKDMFERYYQKHLARRLLHNKSENPEAEKLMISRMQQELGKTFTLKFEGMFKDMATSEELTRDYHSYVRGLGDAESKVELSISVLTTNNWPPEVMGRSSQLEYGQPADPVYPPEIKLLQQSFFKYYLKDRSGRKLNWVGSAGSADVKCVFPKIPDHEKGALSKERRYEINVTTYGMVVLMLFNDLAEGEWLGFEAIEAQTNVPRNDLVRALASLSIPPKSRVLLKEPATKTVKPDDRFCFNAQFVSKTVKIKAPVINAVSKIEGDEERKATEEKNNQTRAHIVDAAVVRIMKQRKELTHTALINEVLTQLSSRFQPEVSMVKRRIEDLITREYLERIEDAKVASYRYLA